MCVAIWHLALVIAMHSLVLANGSTCDPICVQMSLLMALPEDVLPTIVMCFGTLDLLAVAATNKTLRDMSAEHLTAAQKAVQAFKTANIHMPEYSLRQWASLTKLDLMANYIGDSGATVLAGAIHALASLEELFLSYNNISDKGVKALVDACASGALANCTYISLHGNQIGDVGLTALASACASGALPALQVLVLCGNNIGDAGLTALADVCASGAVGNGALDHLEVRWRPAALFPCLETWQVHSPDSEHLFDLP